MVPKGEFLPTSSGDVLRFDPRTEACLPVLVRDGGRGSVRMVGLIEALEEAEQFAGLAGSTPGENVAMIELLLAVLYASNDAPATSGQWLAAVEERKPFTLA